MSHFPCYVRSLSSASSGVHSVLPGAFSLSPFFVSVQIKVSSYSTSLKGLWKGFQLLPSSDSVAIQKKRTNTTFTTAVLLPLRVMAAVIKPRLPRKTTGNIRWNNIEPMGKFASPNRQNSASNNKRAAIINPLFHSS